MAQRQRERERYKEKERDRQTASETEEIVYNVFFKLEGSGESDRQKDKMCVLDKNRPVSELVERERERLSLWVFFRE